jgi:predicted MFS family arabinose efflux permease
MWPAATLVSGAITAGAVVTFIPLYAQAAGAIVVSASLFVHGLTAALSRLIAGRHGDRRGQHGVIAFGLLATALSAAAVASSTSAVAILCGTAGLGVGFGLLQSGSLGLMLERAPQRQADAVSAAWNIAYDLGLGLGGLGFGLVSGAAGYGCALNPSRTAMSTIKHLRPAPVLFVASSSKRAA